MQVRNKYRKERTDYNTGAFLRRYLYRLVFAEESSITWNDARNLSAEEIVELNVELDEIIKEKKRQARQK